MLGQATARYLLEVAGRTYELDAYWPDQRLAVEYDSWEFHSNLVSFREDRIRRFWARHPSQEWRCMPIVSLNAWLLVGTFRMWLA